MYENVLQNVPHFCCSQVVTQVSLFPRFGLYESPEPSQLRCDSVPTPGLSCDRSHGEVLIPIQGAQLSNDVSFGIYRSYGQVRFSKQIWTSYKLQVASNLRPTPKKIRKISVMPRCELFTSFDQLIIQVYTYIMCDSKRSKTIIHPLDKNQFDIELTPKWSYCWWFTNPIPNHLVCFQNPNR